MIELLYPASPAPLIGSCPADGKLLPVVDELGRVYARAGKERCDDKDSPLLHPAVHLHLLDREGRFFLRGGSDVSFAENVPYGKSFDDVIVDLGRYNALYVNTYVPQFADRCLLVQLYVALASSVNVEGKWLTVQEIEQSADLSEEFMTDYTLFGDKMLAFL